MKLRGSRVCSRSIGLTEGNPLASVTWLMTSRSIDLAADVAGAAAAGAAAWTVGAGAAAAAAEAGAGAVVGAAGLPVTAGAAVGAAGGAGWQPRTSINSRARTEKMARRMGALQSRGRHAG